MEDEYLLADVIAEGLRDQGFAVDVAYDGAAALERCAVNDLVLRRPAPVHRQRLARVAHPLTTAKALVEVAVAASTSSEDVHRLGGKLLTVIAGQERLLDGLLALAYSETTLDRDTRVDLAELAAAAVNAYGDKARDAGIELRTALSPAPLYADPVLLGRVVHNLVDNAIRYNVRHRGWVTIHSGLEPDGTATISVTNSGPVVEATEGESLFEPFRRLRYDRTGSPAAPDWGCPSSGPWCAPTSVPCGPTREKEAV